MELNHASMRGEYDRGVEKTTEEHVWKILIACVDSYEKKDNMMTRSMARALLMGIIKSAHAQGYEEGKRDERKAIIDIQDDIIAKAKCPPENNCGLCQRGLERKCYNAEYDAISKALNSIKPSPTTNSKDSV